MDIEEIRDRDGVQLALVVQTNSVGDGVHFLTPPSLQQQVAVMKRASGDIIPAHTHLPVERSVEGTQEVLFIVSGILEADIFDESRRHVQSLRLASGSLIILIRGGHGFRVVKNCEFIEVKQGPYTPEKDKEIF